MMLISESYRALNATLHESHRYGERGDKWAAKVMSLCATFVPDSILDYGCGKGALRRALASQQATRLFEYDPAIPDKSILPAPADLVVCTDVLEHIEPDCIDAVIGHLKSLTLKALFVVVSTRPAAKLLADGRNAHLIVQPMQDWLPGLSAGMSVAETILRTDEFALTLVPQPHQRGQDL